jgi:hypothetical protein
MRAIEALETIERLTFWERIVIPPLTEVHTNTHLTHTLHPYTRTFFMLYCSCG